MKFSTLQTIIDAYVFYRTVSLRSISNLCYGTFYGLIRIYFVYYNAIYNQIITDASQKPVAPVWTILQLRFQCATHILITCDNTFVYILPFYLEIAEILRRTLQ